MGMNYYVISKNSNNLARELFKTYEDLYNTDKLNDVIKSVIMNEFNNTLDLISSTPEISYKFDIFEDALDETIQHFVSDIKYGVLDILDIDEQKSIHIGKSSFGWLFNFQIQNTEIDGVHVEWHNYKQVKAWLDKYVTKEQKFIIKDEEDRIVSVAELFDLIDTKQKDPKNLENPDNFEYCMNVDGYRFSSGDFS